MTHAHYMVTGGAGFIGSHVVAKLEERGHAVTVLDDFCTGLEANLAPFTDAIRLVRGSVADPPAVQAAVAPVPRAIIHLAALPSVARSIEAPLESHRSGATGTVAVLDAARQAGTCVVYAGSSSAYGGQNVPAKVGTLRESSLSPYAAAKLSGERYCRAFALVYGFPVIVTRFFNVFGPRQVPNSPYSGVIAPFCFALLQGRAPRTDGDGEQSRDFTYISDFVRGVLMAADADTEGCHVVNLACGVSHTVNELLRILNDYSGVAVEPRLSPPPAGDVRHSRADTRAAKELLAFETEISFAEGLRRTFDWYATQLGSGAASRGAGP